VVLEEGRVVESGRHADLLAAGGLYRRLYEMQFAREEDKEPALFVGSAHPTRRGSAK
jgi:ABC-type antimicrobial peptide transport system ATPase subunit